MRGSILAIDGIHHNLADLREQALDQGYGLLAYLIQSAIEEAAQVRSELLAEQLRSELPQRAPARLVHLRRRRFGGASGKARRPKPAVNR